MAEGPLRHTGFPFPLQHPVDGSMLLLIRPAWDSFVHQERGTNLSCPCTIPQKHSLPAGCSKEGALRAEHPSQSCALK